LFERLDRKEKRNIEETKKDIIKIFQNNSNTDLAITSYTLSLLCPITITRMFTPAKSSQCEHLECFDALAFIKMNENSNKWKCPICNLNCLYDDLKIDKYILSILNNPGIKNRLNVTSIKLSPSRF
jgi:SUMO ligase MMS21 Smc5/6 complex component